ncbi:MAG: ATP-dependent Clp protease proteolytic subunit [Firmicutes bacterium]|nr:ATP-dependent Clp protease proteolytic subunit [Bacillota bacterium]
MNNQNADLKKEERQQVVELGSDLTSGKDGRIYTLTIIGQVEGHQVLPETAKTTKYEHVLPLLAGIEESDEIDGLLLLLNTVGGDIEAGLAIAEMIAGMRKPTVSLVLGGGHSIGIPLAVCTKKSFITPTASMTVHPVRMTGLVVGAPQTFRYFQRIQEQITDFVTANSRISREVFEHYMMATGEMATDVGTILYGKEAVASGLIDRLGGLHDALSALHKMIDKRKPEGKEAEK